MQRKNLMRNIKCKSCANLKNDWCDKKNDSPDPELVRDCSHYRVMTNADHIRGMTDEKLAELFAGMCQANADGESHCYACLLNAWCPACGYKDDWLEWLQQPYKENEDG